MPGACDPQHRLGLYQLPASALPIGRGNMWRGIVSRYQKPSSFVMYERERERERERECVCVCTSSLRSWRSKQATKNPCIWSSSGEARTRHAAGWVWVWVWVCGCEWGRAQIIGADCPIWILLSVGSNAPSHAPWSAVRPATGFPVCVYTRARARACVCVCVCECV